VLTTVALVVCAAGAVGCSKKIDECNALIQQLNEASTAVQAQTTGLITNPKEAEQTLTQLASTTKEQSDKIAGVQLTIPELAKFSKDYQGMLSEMVDSASAMGKAASDLKGIEDSVSKDRQAWMSASSSIRIACIKARKECEKLGDTLTKPPMVTGLRPDEDAKKLDEYSKAIASIEVKDEGVQKAVDDIKASLGSFAATLRKVDAASKAVDKAEADMKATADKEPPLIKNINDFCQGNK
jgi:chromosome segregation ATPase